MRRQGRYSSLYSVPVRLYSPRQRCISSEEGANSFRLTLQDTRLYVIAESSGPVRSRQGVSVVPDHTFEDAPPLDVLLVPGGLGKKPAAHLLSFRGSRRSVELRGSDVKIIMLSAVAIYDLIRSCQYTSHSSVISVQISTDFC